jgi:hypothetical protein
VGYQRAEQDEDGKSNNKICEVYSRENLIVADVA